MSDISIPGFSNPNSGLDTERVINDLVELERIPLTRVENRITENETLREVWQSVGRRVNRLATHSAELYGFQNPFRNRTGASTDEGAVRISAVRNAENTEHTVTVNALASRDRFSSTPLPDDYRVPAGTYTFGVGEDEVDFSFSGGSLSAFTKAVNDNGRNVLTAQAVNYSRDRQVITLSAETTGTDNRLQFLNDARDFAIDAEIVRPINQNVVEIDNRYTATPGETLRIDINPPYPLTEGGAIQFEAYSQRLSDEQRQEFSIDSIGSVTVEGVTVKNLPSEAPLKSAALPAAPVNNRSEFVSLVFADGSERTLEPFADGQDFTTIRLPFEKSDEVVVGLRVENANTHRVFQIQNITLSNIDEGTLEPINPIEIAGDAEIEFDGIPVVRTTNTIDDLIPGGTIELRGITRQPVGVEITPDYDQIKASVINFVGSYNQLLRDINILERNDSQIIDEVEFFTDEEREAARENLGLLSGDSAIGQLRNRLIFITQNSYETSAGREINLLVQLGIGSNVVDNAGGGGVDFRRLRGYLQMDEEQFDQKLRENTLAVQELFGNDTDGDLVVDSGIAFETRNYVNVYDRSGGIIDSRITGIDQRIERDSTQVTTYTERLDDYEQRLRVDFGRMQSAIDSLDDTTRTLDQLNNSSR